jgi:hypothetical protein
MEATMTRTLYNSCFLAVVLLISTGCQQWVRPPENVATTQADAENAMDKSPDYVQPIVLENFKFPGETETAYRQALADTTGETRNRLQLALIAQSNTNCDRYIDRLYIRVATRKWLYQTGALLTAGSAAIVGGGLASQILAGTSTGLLGIDAISDNEALQGQLVTMIIDTIRTTREQEYVELAQKRTKNSTAAPLSEYSVDQSIIDVSRDYHGTCSFTTAVSELSKLASAPKGITREALIEERSNLATKLAALVTELKDTNAFKGIPDIRAGKLAEADRYQKRIAQIDYLLIVKRPSGVTPN